MVSLPNGNNDPEPPKRCGQRLLPSIIDEIAFTDAKRTFALVPKTANPEDGFTEIDFGCFARAIDACAWWLQRELGGPFTPKTVAYLGPLDLMYHIVSLAATKVGHVVSEIFFCFAFRC